MAHVWRRLVAALMDFPIIMIWALSAGVIGVVVRWLGFLIDTPVGWDIFAFATLVAPVAVTFAVMESAPRSATPGKRRLGLVVVHRPGEGLSLRRSLARSAVKFTPWQMGHTAVFHLAAGSTETGYLALAIAAQVLVLVSIAIMILDRRRRSLHDLLAGTRVIDREDGHLNGGGQPL